MISEVSPSSSVVLTAGAGQVGFGPPSGTKWALRLASCEVSSATLQPQVAWYRGSATGPIELIDQSFTGAKASTGKVGGAFFYPGQWLWAAWTGGDAGATATLRAWGQQGGRSDPLLPAPLGEGAVNSTSIIVGNELIIIGSDGSEIHAYLLGGSAVLDFLPARIPGHTVDPSRFSTGRTAPNGPFLNITSPDEDSGAQSQIQMVGGSPALAQSFIGINADFIDLTTTTTVPFGGFNVTGETQFNDKVRLASTVFVVNETPSGLTGMSLPRGIVGDMSYTGGTGATSAGAAEAALPAWTNAGNGVSFVDTRLYYAIVSGGAFSSVLSSNEIADIRLRSAVNSTIAQQLGQVRVEVGTAGNVLTFERGFYIKNVSGAQVDKTSLGVTVARTGAGTGNESIFGNGGNFPLTVTVHDIGLAADHPALSAIAAPIT